MSFLINSYQFAVGGGFTPVHYWALDDGGGGPYSDTGSTGGEDMSQVGTVTDDGTFGGVSFAGAGAVAAPDTASVWDNLFSGADKQFSFKVEFEFDNFTNDSYLVSRLNTAAGERSFICILRSGGAILDFIWYGANNASILRVIRKTITALSTGTAYKIALSYDGTIDTNNGLDRPILFIDGTEYSFDSVVSSSGALSGIVATGAQLSVGAGVSGAGSLQSSGATSGNARKFAVYDTLIDATEAGA